MGCSVSLLRTMSITSYSPPLANTAEAIDAYCATPATPARK